MRKAETLSYESEGWLENRGQTSTTIKKKNWLKKPNFARVEVLHTRTGEVITTLIGDGDYFWTFWQDGFPRSRNERWQNVYMKEPVEGYSIARDARLLTSRPVIDPSIFHVSTDEPWWQSHMDGVRRVGTEKVGDEECEVIEVIFMNRRISQYLWLAKVDHLPRKLKKVVLSSRLEEPRGESIKHEIWTNVRINAEIPMENFVWKPPSSWRRITQSMLLPREHSVTESINLSGKWKYTFGDNTSWSGRDYDDREWDTAEVPYILPSLKAGKYLWLRKMFFVPEHYKGQKYGLDLGLLSAPVSVYFNGDLVAESEKDSPLILLKPLNVMFGENNVIALRIERKETDMIVWTGEPLLLGLSGWIETGYFNEEYYTVVHYMIYVPKNYNPDKVFPLVIAMPGYPYGSRSFMGSDIVKFAESRGYIVLCPEARPGERGHRWIVRAQREVLLILSEMKEDYIDARRIYIMGQSNGGFAAYYIGFHNSELFAGITSCSGGIGSKIELLPRMAKAAKEFIPIYIVHGA
ncbi:MAG: prolyl oligopeptidase family serine peptidase, partial [Deltaproteobacteria bacterium]|nr:prolyl oligopeptidase family serine peptidase [Deltaproteobacteria bacterium]